MTYPVFCASVGLLGAAIYATGGGKPLLGLVRAIVYVRAAAYLAAEMIDGARSRTNRWDECVQRSRTEV